MAAYAEQVAELATVEERNRLARDIHDSLGHYLTVIGIQLEKAAAVLRDDHDETLVSIQNAKRMTDQALEDVRQSVGALREKQPAFILHDALKQLVENFQAASFEVILSVKGDEKTFTRQQLMTLYRAAQEGLTNVQKHACAQHVTLEVLLNQEAAWLTLTDDGVGIQDLQEMGMGWRGLRERLELISGRLDIESRPSQGTTLHVHISRRGVNI
ncbi:MAG: sensor histidine kinase [Chloroflexaceae bacterium]|nr:sensor histidine kinase [Chloroflexaceae bacterium]